MHFSLVLVGAHDGSKSESLIASARQGGHVLLIEPVPWLFARLCDKYKAFQDVHVAMFAVSTVDGEADFFAPVESANDVAFWGDQLGSLNPVHAVEHDPRFAGKIETVKVATRSFELLIKDYEMSSIDTLMTDTEGHDPTILATFPFDMIRPRQIQFEHKHSDGVFHIGKKFARIVVHLELMGYRLQILDSENCLATLRDGAAAAGT